MRWLVLLALTGCDGILPGVDWQQMIHQHKFRAYDACAYFPDGRALQAPPPRTVAHVAPDKLEPARTNGRYLEHFAIPLTRETFAAGRRAFEAICATCHAADGSGQSEVARNMELRRPPSLIAGRPSTFPPGRIYEVVSEGFGLMPSYAHELSPEERWAVVAYVVALQRSQAAELDKLPPELRRETLTTLGRTP